VVDRLEELTWWRETVGPRLASETYAGAAIELTSAAIVGSPELRRRPLGELLPALGSVCEGVPSTYLDSVRAWNVLRRSCEDTWAELAAHSAATLAAWPNAGPKVLTEIVATALEAWLRAGAEAAPDASAAAAHAAEQQQPRAAGPLDADADLEQAWCALLDFNQRALRILAARSFALAEPLTLAELGEQLGVTRERIRQIERDRREDLEVRAARARECAPIAQLAAQLRQRLGALAPADAADAALREAVPDGARDAELRRGVLLALAGPYRLHDGFRQLGCELAQLKEAIAARAEAPWSEAELELLLDQAGVVAQQRPACLAALPLHRVEGRLLTWTGSLADKACRVLRVHGAPMSRDELQRAIGPDVNLRSLLGQVQEDARLRRLGRDSYGLAEWGGEAYTTIADELAQAIERRGGRAPLDELVEELVERFGVSPQSVRSYAASRRFAREPGGTLAVAPDDAAPPEVPRRMPPELDRDLVRHRGTWTLRVAVNRDVLRGSGRAVRTAIAQAAGVEPGGARTIVLRDGRAQISWQALQPAVGSLRALVETIGCAEGDYLFLPLRDGARPYAVARGALEAARGTARLALELGLPADARLAAVASALGLPAGARAAEVRARLRARRQPQLEALVRDEDERRGEPASERLAS
jgi:transcriptional regulator with XRE-family HTH domain